MKQVPYKSTELVCLKCGNVMTILRKALKQKKVGHIKDMYCPYCKEQVKFFEVRDVSAFKWQCQNAYELTELEQLVFNFLKEREENNGKQECGVYKKILTKK